MARPVPPPERTRERIRSLTLRVGVSRAAQLLDLAEATTARLAGGLPVNPATAAHADRRLDAIESEGDGPRAA